jgi:hypothetical protein
MVMIGVMRTHPESARSVPMVDEIDVLVAGAGPAGIAAAIAAARQGVRVRLIEQRGCLGGVWTAGLLSWILDQGNKGGLMREVVDRLQQGGATWPVRGSACAYDPERMKLLLEELCLQAGVQVRLHTRVCGAARDTDGRLAVVVTESKSGREAWALRAAVDASGDGDLAAQAGCACDVGRPGDGLTQPMSLLCLLAGPPAESIPTFMHDGTVPGGADKANLAALLRAHGADPSYGAPTLFPIARGLYALMANHEYGASALDAQSITDATMRARAEVHRLVAALRAAGGPWTETRVVATAEHIGVREGRRIRGRHQVGVDELVAGARHPDPVCRATFGIDVHALSGDGDRSFDPASATRIRPYDIPLRALLAADCDGLLLAGRCISGDFLAHSSYRVTGNAVAMGEAAGACAALAARSGRLPHQVAWDELAVVLPHLAALREN